MRNVFIALLVVNLVYFGWSHWVDEPKAPAVNEALSKLPRLKLLSERPSEQPAAQRPASGTKTVANETPACMSVGPFGDVGNAAKAAAILTARGFAPHQRAEEAGSSAEHKLPQVVYWIDVAPRPGMTTVPLTDLFAEGVGSRVAVQPCPAPLAPSATAAAQPAGAAPSVQPSAAAAPSLPLAPAPQPPTAGSPAATQIATPR